MILILKLFIVIVAVCFAGWLTMQFAKLYLQDWRSEISRQEIVDFVNRKNAT